MAKIEIAELNIKFVGDTAALQKGVQRADAVVTASFRKVENASGGVEKSFDKVDKATKRLDTDAVNLAARMQILTQAYDVFKSSVNKAIDLAKLGAQAERVEDRFQKFAATIGDADEILEAFNRGSGGTVDSLSAMNQAALLIQQGLVTTNDEMEKTVEMATRLGDQTLGATNRLEFFSQLLKNQSIRLLDNFGISSGKVRTRIKELMDATAGLTREEAFRIATFEEGQKALDVLGERVDDHAMKFERATVRLQEFRIEMGQKLMPVLAKGADFVSKLDSATLALIGAFTGALGIAVKFTGGLSGLITKLGLTGTQFGLLAAAIGTTIAAYEAIRRIQKNLEEGQEAANKAIASWSDEVQEAVEGGADLGKEMEYLASRVNDADKALHKNGNIIQDMAAALVRSTSETKIMTEAADEARKVIIKQADSLEEANRLVKIYNERVDNADAELEEFTAEIWDNIDGLVAQNAAVNVWARGMERGRKNIEETAKAEEAHAKSMERQVQAMTQRGLQAVALQEQQYRLGRQLLQVEKDYQQSIEEKAEVQAQAAEEAAEAAAKELEAQQKALEAYLARVEKQLEAQEALRSAQLRRAEALKDADAEDVARTAISELERAQRAGIISFEDYAKAVVEIQDKFGLADDESRALTLGLGALVGGLADGSLEAANFGEALALMIEDAQDGVIAFDALLERVANMGEAMQTAIRLAGTPRAPGTARELPVAGAYGTMAGAAPTGVTSERIGRTGPGAAPAGGGGLVIYGGVHLSGVEDAEDFLRQLMSVME